MKYAYGHEQQRTKKYQELLLMFAAVNVIVNVNISRILIQNYGGGGIYSSSVSMYIARILNPCNNVKSVENKRKKSARVKCGGKT
jgi:hypothetical protein